MRIAVAFGVVLAGLALASSSSAAEDVLRGHGGPVRSLTIGAGPHELVSGSFDSAVIVWDLERNVAKRVLRFHDGAVNVVTALNDGCLASAGEDNRIAIWCGSSEKPAHVLEGHQAKITSLASLDGGKVLASGSFDRTVRVWDLPGGQRSRDQLSRDQTSRVLTEHPGPVTSLAASVDGRGVVSGDMEGNVRHTRIGIDEGPPPLALGAPVTALVVARDGEGIMAGADGRLRFARTPEHEIAELEVESIPLASLAVSSDDKLIATAGLRGGITIIDRASRTIVHRLTGPGLPVWSLMFDPDNRTLYSGGADRVIRRWDAVKGEPLSSNLPEHDPVAEAVASGERGAQVFRACQACHTLSVADGNRAGPTLAGIFGRRIGTAPGYAYSDAFPRMNIVWNRETIARLFEVGPTALTPGTKMPEQTIADPADRQALVEWLERVTTSR